MAASTLDPDNMPEPDRVLGKGHGTAALGPSDLSDSGSDLMGGAGMAQQVGLGLDTGTTSDPEDSTAHNTAGPDLGDADLDSDSDSGGTGEVQTASRDSIVRPGQDIDVDRIDSISNLDVDEELDPVEGLDALDTDERPHGDPAGYQPAFERPVRNHQPR